MINPRVFVFGLGYSASAFARAAVAAGIAVSGTARDEAKRARLGAAGIDAIPFEDEAVKAALTIATHVIASVAPDDVGDPVLTRFGKALSAAPQLRWLGYLSTVGVYGDRDGEWVSEETPPAPRSDRARRRLAAEQTWTALAKERGVPFAVFRIAGIYGPGRNAFVNLADGKAHRVVKPGQVFNRIHVDDVAAALLSASTKQAAGIFNLADDLPAPPQDVVTYAAGLMGVAPPPDVPLDEAALSPMARSFYSDNKRVMNHRLKSELEVRLRHPTYKEGLNTLWNGGNWRN